MAAYTAADPAGARSVTAPPTVTYSQTPLLLLVGMHRSGTSLLGSLLPELGVPVPGPLIQGDTHNPQGYYERTDITALQEDLLLSLGHWWPSQEGVLDLPPDWLDRPPTLMAARSLRALLAGEIERQRGPWAIKDPRSSLLLPLWRQVAAELGLPLQLVLCVRDPAEVAASLMRRDHRAAGMTPWRAQQLWWRHTTQVLLEGRGLPLHVVHYSDWFGNDQEAAEQVRQLARFCRGLEPSPATVGLALERIRPEHRRSIKDPRRLVPIHPLLRRLEQQLRQTAAGILPRNVVEQDLWASPQPITLPLSHWRHGTRPVPATPLHPDEHPWAAAALARHGGHHARARHQLSHWRQQGTLSCADLAQIALAPQEAFPLLSKDIPLPAIAEVDLTIQSYGESWRTWPLHGWLQQIPLALDSNRTRLLPGETSETTGNDDIEAALRLALHEQSIACSAEQRALLELAAMAAVFDRNRERVDAMRRLGIRAYWLTTGQPNSWLRQEGDVAAMASRLGLPDPTTLATNATHTATMGETVLALGSGGLDWERNLCPPYWCLPGFDRLIVESVEDARLVAAWLDRCQELGMQLLRFDPSETERRLNGAEALRQPDPRPKGWLALQSFRSPLAVQAVAEELAWRQEGCPTPGPCHTPVPSVETLWTCQEGPVATAGVIISLHNYADRIVGALESVRAQSLAPLELVVVDDASTDGGEEVVRRWLERHGERFSRAILLRHHENGGLAAARNTAFTALTAPWCFVLDADNALLPEAVECCLTVAQAAPASTAVVHSLVEVVGEGAIPPENADGQPAALLSPLAWQAQHFFNGNFVDAMALVRVAAWRQVGGYTHIPGGWEDFDFWCQLIEAGFHGVLCPQRLARYHRHGNSMLVNATHRHVRRISRILQARHPWLQLPMAESGA